MSDVPIGRLTNHAQHRASDRERGVEDGVDRRRRHGQSRRPRPWRRGRSAGRPAADASVSGKVVMFVNVSRSSRNPALSSRAPRRVARVAADFVRQRRVGAAQDVEGRDVDERDAARLQDAPHLADGCALARRRPGSTSTSNDVDEIRRRGGEGQRGRRCREPAAARRARPTRSPTGDRSTPTASPNSLQPVEVASGAGAAIDDARRRRPPSASSSSRRALRRRPLNQKCRSSARAVASSIRSIGADCHRFRRYCERNRASFVDRYTARSVSSAAPLAYPRRVVHRDVFTGELDVATAHPCALPGCSGCWLVALTGACGKKQPPGRAAATAAAAASTGCEHAAAAATARHPAADRRRRRRRRRPRPRSSRA